MNLLSLEATALSTVVSLALLWVLVYWFYRRYRVDQFRQRMFALRDQLFDFARSGEIQFDSPAYGILRTTMNGFIRFGERLGFISLMLGSREMSRHRLPKDREFPAQWARATEHLPPETREQLNRMVVQMHDMVVEQILLSSPLLLLTLLPLVAWFIVRHMGRAMARRFFSQPYQKVRRRWLDPLDSAAFVCGAAA